MSRLVTLFVILLLGACDTVGSRYPSLEEARKDRLFGRGWLPNILPQSARQIQTVNDLDLNTSAGEFYFEPNDFEKLHKQLSEATENNGQSGMAGYTSYQYTNANRVWIFTCSSIRGHCKYTMATVRSGG